MRTIGLSGRTPCLAVAMVLLSAGAVLYAAAEETPLPTLAALASALSQNDAQSALDVFDKAMPGYSGLETNLTALTGQSEILCAIDVVSDKEAEGVHTLDVDWYMQVKSQAGSGPAERRRERVTLQMKVLRGKWRITSFSPLSILAPVTIQ